MTARASPPTTVLWWVRAWSKKPSRTWVCGRVALRHRVGSRWVVQAMMLSTSRMLTIRKGQELNMWKTPSTLSGIVQPRYLGCTCSRKDR